ncbi:isochorismatase family protein [Sporosarcina cascadiensis]|uniref:isochorismatase family protein n=1 Tax=Sporosarcina cascadiensis TaxID=2660747 RepID=UPI00129A58B1|nr:isochorismatase family protein [Sporosarcina cascadiensis]
MLNSHGDDENIFVERGFGKSLGIGKQAALVVVDLILGFTSPDMPMGSDLTQQIKNTNKLIKVSRENNIPIFFTTISYDEEDVNDAGIWAKKMEGLATLLAGTDAVKVDPSLDFRKGDGLIVKKYASSFFGTDLVSRLIKNRVDTVIIVGATTSGCIRATAVDAIQYGFTPIVAEDAVGDREQKTHEQSLIDMQQKYADVKKTEEIIFQLTAVKVV